ncbi:hypothetical protein Ocin01_14902 [Orchesella cincta]|uniref:Uncharacterized protein n=1 Tax=Orchesella cincta TaxID=48709 RepID=A0A1D2MFM8_ORCCI|nr:hypothetical protein Ocin01_14902 [Orchesella cincta]
MISLKEFGFKVLHRFFPLYPILQIVFTIMTISAWGLFFSPLNWFVTYDEGKYGESRKKDTSECSHKVKKADMTESRLPPLSSISRNEPTILISYDPESQSLIQNSFCVVKTPFIPSGEHLSGTNEVVAELKLLHQRMKSLKRIPSKNANIDEDDLTMIMPIPKPRTSLLARKRREIETDIDTSPVPHPRESTVA